MRILLVGEYSGVHTDLATALRKIGHYVITAHAGDDFKNYPRDLDLRPSGSTFFSRRISMFFKYINLSRFIEENQFDVIQFINTGVLPKWLDRPIYNKVFKSGAKVFFLGAGEDNVVWDAYRSGAYRYYAFDGMKSIDKVNKKNKWDSSYLINQSKWVLQKANAIIPLCVEYKIAYEKYYSNIAFIPLSINTSIVPNRVEAKDYGKIIILHGINRGREGYKGSNYIVRALEKIKEKYGKKIEVIISENISFSEYLKLLFKVNVVVDQCLCYSVSMNALYSMLSGCVVLGGCEKEYLESLSIKAAPIINILPNSDDIYEKLEQLINEPEAVKRTGIEAFKFVNRYHSIDRNVNKFIDVWNNY